jgi:uncharacterized membrane protein YqiK
LKTGKEILKLYKYQKGGDAIINPLTQYYKILPANKIVLEVESKEVRTADDFFIAITTVIIFSIDSSSESQMEVAFEAFGNLATEKTKIDDFKKGVLEILKPLVSSATSTIISGLTYESLIKEEEQFNDRAKDTIEGKFATMGLIITSISLKDGSIDNQLYIKALKDKKTIEIEKKLVEEKAKYEQFKSDKQLEEEKYRTDKELEKEKYKSESEKVLQERAIELERFKSDKELEKEKHISKQKIEKEKQDLENKKILLEQEREQERFESEKKLEKDKQDLENAKILLEQEMEKERFKSEKELENEKHIAKQKIEKEKYDLENAKILQEAKIEKEKQDLENEKIIREQKIDLERFESEKELEKIKRLAKQKIEKEKYDLENAKVLHIIPQEKQTTFLKV